MFSSFSCKSTCSWGRAQLFVPGMGPCSSCFGSWRWFLSRPKLITDVLGPRWSPCECSAGASSRAHGCSQLHIPACAWGPEGVKFGFQLPEQNPQKAAPCSQTSHRPWQQGYSGVAPGCSTRTPLDQARQDAAWMSGTGGAGCEFTHYLYYGLKKQSYICVPHFKAFP